MIIGSIYSYGEREDGERLPIFFYFRLCPSLVPAVVSDSTDVSVSSRGGFECKNFLPNLWRRRNFPAK